MNQWLLVAAALILVVGAISAWVGRARESSRAEGAANALLQGASNPTGRRVDFASFSELPPPVARYLENALTDGQPFIRSVSLRQSGVLRTKTTAEAWSSFTARQLVVPSAPGFVWNAKVQTPLATHVRVLDSYIAGAGAGSVSLLSAFPVASERGAPELSSGALHRFLAESPWYPTALLPQSGVTWSPIDERAALATLTDGDVSVSLELRFNEAGEVAGIYSPGRFGRFDGEYKQVPWEGRFRDYRTTSGMRVPHYGEVGWYDQGDLKLVWKGNIVEIQHELEP